MRWLMMALLTLFFTGCGGGGGGSGGGGSTSVTVESRSVVVDNGQISGGSVATVDLSFSNLPSEDIYGGVDSATYTAIDYTELQETGDTTAQLIIHFRPGSELGEGNFTDTLTLAFCYDGYCNRHISGSPIEINTELRIAFDGSVTSEGSYSVIATPFSGEAGSAPTEHVQLSLDGADPEEVYVKTGHTTHGLFDVTDAFVEGGIDVGLVYQNTYEIDPGYYRDTVTVEVCYDEACHWPLAGSPVTIDSEYFVGIAPSENIETAQVRSRTSLAHDIVDAEYSEALHAAVMVSTSPENALYVYNFDTSTEEKILLSISPKAVSVDVTGSGTRFAIGHDGWVTVVDYSSTEPSASVSTVLNVSTEAADVVVRGDTVYVMPASNNFEEIHAVNISDNNETLGEPFAIQGNSRIKLHPSGNYLYYADRGLYPDDIGKVSIQESVPHILYDSPEHGEYYMCGNLWISGNGERIYTACGNTFRASERQEEDMVYTGRIPLSNAQSYVTELDFKITSIAEAPLSNEISVIERQSWECSDTDDEPCYALLHRFTYDFYSDKGVLIWPLMELNGHQYVEDPRYVFYSVDGNRTFVLTRLWGTPEPISYMVEIEN